MLVYIGGLGGLFLGELPSINIHNFDELITVCFVLRFCARMFIARFYRIDIFLHLGPYKKHFKTFEKINID